MSTSPYDEIRIHGGFLQGFDFAVFNPQVERFLVDVKLVGLLETARCFLLDGGPHRHHSPDRSNIVFLIRSA